MTTSPSSPALSVSELEALLAEERIKNLQLTNLLRTAHHALASCTQTYSEYNQFEGEWNSDFNAVLVEGTLMLINPLLGLPPPTPFERK